MANILNLLKSNNTDGENTKSIKKLIKGDFIIKQKNKIEFISTSFLRGTTFSDCIVVCDEIQNLNWQEIYTVLTRIGHNTKIVICGDTNQIDLIKEQSGIDKLKRILDKTKNFELINFTINDIVRSRFVKDFIISCEEYNQFKSK